VRPNPPGAASEWREVVREKAEPWEESELYEAEELRLALADISATRLQEAARAREVLLAMLGHDLRTPVQALAMVGETLWLDDARIAGVQKQIARISGRMGRLITHVLDLSRLQAGFTLIGAREPRDFGELLSDVINEARLARPKSPLLASFSQLGEVSVDADRITQVLVNLISNARHHGLPGHPVRVEAERTAGQLLVRVINHGRPVNEAALERLFAPFKRGSLDNSGNPRGLGMGLYIASTIVREHGGNLSLSCGEGLVTFTMALPLDT
jgi:signal transduction histidine kinase